MRGRSGPIGRESGDPFIVEHASPDSEVSDAPREWAITRGFVPKQGGKLGPPCVERNPKIDRIARLAVEEDPHPPAGDRDRHVVKLADLGQQFGRDVVDS